jgi:hypothetical protein
MQLLPQLRLHTLFLLFFCAAIGLTCATAPSDPADFVHTLFSMHVRQLNVHYALLCAAAAAMVIGLSQQVRFLACSGPCEPNDGPIAFAKSLAIAWRVLIAIGITTCLGMRILIARRLLKLPEGQNTWDFNVVPDAVLYVFTIVVLSDSIQRWKPKRIETRLERENALAWIAVVILTLIVLPHSGFIVYLVNIATQGIEQSARLVFQRANVFPNQQLDHYRIFWRSLAAVVAVASATLLLASTLNRKLARGRLIALFSTCVVLLSASAAYVAWFYMEAYPRLAPDFTSVGFGSDWLDWVGGVILAALGITVGAYRSATNKELEAVAIPTQGKANEAAFHESPLCLLFLFGAAIAYFVETIHSMLDAPNYGANPGILLILGELLLWPSSCLLLALTLLSIQLCWLRWKRRRETVVWKLKPILPGKFAWTWLAFALLVTVAIPTLTIYACTFWLGPWYLYGP